MNRKLFSIVLLTGMLVLPVAAHSATLIERQDTEQGYNKMWVQDGKIRATTGQGQQYALINYQQRNAYIVDPQQREIIDISSMMQDTGNASQGISVKVERLGNGPSIAGYATEKYRFSADGQVCEQTLVSRQALKDSNMASMIDMLGRTALNPMAAQMLSACDRAHLQFAKRYRKIGLPMGTIEAGGRIENRVQRIDNNASLPAGGFNLPKGYRQVSMQQKMQEAMQHSGGMPPLPPGSAGQQHESLPPHIQQKMDEMMRQFGGQ